MTVQVSTTIAEGAEENAHFFHLHDFDTKHERERKRDESAVFYELLSS